MLGHPEHAALFRCGVLWNPVTNLPSMVTVTDIPEWCFAECLPPGNPGLAWPLSHEQARRPRPTPTRSRPLRPRPQRTPCTPLRDRHFLCLSPAPTQIAAMYDKSPISVVANVKVPALMLLGAADVRVPHSQGREWVAALQAQPSPPEVVALEYPGEGHAIAGAEQQAHAVQTAVAWLLEHTAAD